MPLVYGSDWIDWHPDPVYKVHGGDPSWGTYNIEGDNHPVSAANALLRTSGNNAAFSFTHAAFDPDYPSDDPECGFYQVSRGLSGSDVWTGVCPFFPVGTFDNLSATLDGSAWNVTDSIRFGVGDIQSVSWQAIVGGWQLKPWLLYSDYANAYMDDDDLLAELVAATSANYPSEPGLWFVTFESPDSTGCPIFEGMEFAPDEAVAPELGEPYVNSGTIGWIENPTGWGYYKDSDDFAWFGNDTPGGDIITEYPGGVASWQAAPDHWLPTQGSDGNFVVPEDEYAATVALTTAEASLYSGSAPAAPGEGEEAEGGRLHQTLAFRLKWRLPRFRYARFVDYYPVAPIRTLQRGKDGLVGSGTNVLRRGTVQRGLRTIGGTK